MLTQERHNEILRILTEKEIEEVWQKANIIPNNIFSNQKC